MKFLISNYSSPENTEALYFNTTLNNIGCKSTLWNHEVSAFDVFDITKPDIYITHVNTLHNDTIVYLSQNKNIDIILNITGIQNIELNRLDEIFKEQNIVPKFYFNNNPNHNLQSKNNIVLIQHSADLYIVPSNDLLYSIDCGIIVDKENQMIPYGETYHFISNNKNLDKKADIVLPIVNLSSIYNNYNKLIFKYFDGYFKQIFFDASYYGKSIYFDMGDTTYKHNLSKLLGEDGLCDLNNDDSGNIKELIKKKHTCLHRVKTLISQLSAHDQINNLSKLIEEKTQ